MGFLKKLLGKKAIDEKPEPKKQPQTVEVKVSKASPPIETKTEPVKEVKVKPVSEPVFKKNVLKFLNTEYVINEDWLNLFTHFILLQDYKKMPSKEWYDETKGLIEKVGQSDFISIGSKWIHDCVEKSKENQMRFSKLGALAANEQMQKDLGFTDRKVPEWVDKVYGDKIASQGFIRMEQFTAMSNFQNYFYQSLGGRILRGFVQSAVIIEDEKLIELVDLLAFTDPNSSQDAIHVYTMLPEKIGVPRLTNLKGKAKSKRILGRIDKAIAAIGKKSGKSKSEIEETVVPEMGINKDSKFIFKIGDVKCVFEIENHQKQRVYYLLKDGKEQKTIPKHIKDNNPNELTDFKRKIKNIKTSISGQKKRIEDFYLINRTIPYSSFKKNYLNNNLIKIISKDLIWNFQKKDLNVNLIFSNDSFVDVSGKTYSDELKGTKVSLWHPIGSESDYIFKWRTYILENEITQGFKQAFREIYVITDAELSTENYSNRFASHILNKDQVAALCKARGWSPSGLTNHGKVFLKIPESDYKAEYWTGDVDLGERSRLYGSAHITTDQVRFYKKKEQLKLSEIPEIIFSEVMRDVDLFVGVTSIGNDPAWFDRGNDGADSYWRTYTNGELTERSNTRVEILKNLIPKLKIADQCEFQGKYLHVKGSIREYKIHLGSGNILMSPDDQYLCIVADRSGKQAKNLFIPFEGDNMLSIIISKALLLAEDTKIKDTSILNQINRK